MIKENWRVIVLTLLAANLVSMALLEWQRRTQITREREFTERIEQILMNGDLSQTRAAQVSATAVYTKDIYERVLRIEANVKAMASAATSSR